MTPIETAALDSSVKTAQSFFGKIFGPAADELGMQLADNMRLRRMKNQLKNLDKVRSIVDKDGITMKQIDLKALVPLLEATALEENEELQEMWANLFTNYIDSAKNLTTHVYPDILRQLSSDEVGILKRMRAKDDSILIVETNVLMGRPVESFAYSHEITNLLRLGIIVGVLRFKSEDLEQEVKRATAGTHRKDQAPRQNLPPSRYILTDFGKQFLEACTR